jgi:hypothetical protein
MQIIFPGNNRKFPGNFREIFPIKFQRDNISREFPGNELEIFPKSRKFLKFPSISYFQEISNFYIEIIGSWKYFLEISMEIKGNFMEIKNEVEMSFHEISKEISRKNFQLKCL